MLVPLEQPRVWRVSSQSTTSASRSSRSTRSVTSSRLPIGVAQTASGTSPRRAPRTPIIAGADHAGRRCRAAPRRSDRVARRASSPSRRDAPRAPARASELAGRAEAAADDDQLGLEDVRRRTRCRRRGTCRSRRAPRRAASRRPRPRRTSSSRVDPRPNSFRAQRSRRGPATYDSRCPSPAAGRRAGAVGVDHDVAELGTAAGRAAIRRPSRIRPPPTPVPSVSITTSRAPRAAPARHSPIAAAFASLSSADRQAVPLTHPVAQVDVVERDVHATRRDARALVDPRRDAEADRRDLARRAAPRPSRRARRAAPPARAGRVGRSMPCARSRPRA